MKESTHGGLGHSLLTRMGKIKMMVRMARHQKCRKRIMSCNSLKKVHQMPDFVGHRWNLTRIRCSFRPRFRNQYPILFLSLELYQEMTPMPGLGAVKLISSMAMTIITMAKELLRAKETHHSSRSLRSSKLSRWRSTIWDLLCKEHFNLLSLKALRFSRRRVSWELREEGKIHQVL